MVRRPRPKPKPSTPQISISELRGMREQDSEREKGRNEWPINLFVLFSPVVKRRKQQRDIEKREHKSSKSSNKAYWKRIEDWSAFFAGLKVINKKRPITWLRALSLLRQTPSWIGDKTLMRGSEDRLTTDSTDRFPVAYKDWRSIRYGDFSPFLPCLHSKLVIKKGLENGIKQKVRYASCPIRFPKTRSVVVQSLVLGSPYLKGRWKMAFLMSSLA
ncbi:hypothetical protein SESBI_24473 [Sesbania bispinosa]|nr:hypothetical protein SESBI_24473 [Sesbania bispinosa]